MNCFKCNKEFDDEIIAFCEKCEEYYCMKCTKGHNHGLTFFEYKNGEKYLIPIGFTAAGPNDRHCQFYYEEEWILKNLGCEHVIKKLNAGLPIFNCENNKFYCNECFHNSKLKYIIPLMKSKDGIIRSLIPHKFLPFNLDFNITCDNGTKGKYINSRISIKNNKKNDITDIKIIIESFAAEPLPKNESYDIYFDEIYPFRILYKELHHDLIKSGDNLTLDIKLDIPSDGEIKKGELLKEYYDNGTTNKYCDNNRLNIPQELMIYAYFTYKTCSENTFYSYVETSITKIK